MSLEITVSFPLLAMEICYHATPDSRNTLTGGVRAVVAVFDSSGVDNSGPPFWSEHAAAAAHQLRWPIARAK